MSILEIALLSYIILSQLWTVVFVNSSRRTSHKTWFIITTILLSPISTIIISTQVWLEDRRTKKEKRNDKNTR